MRAAYATRVDVLRQYEMDVQESDFGNDETAGSVFLNRLDAKLQAAESEFESRTHSTFRESRVGTPGQPATYDYHEGKGARRNRTRPLKVYLDHMNIVPFDSNQGDTLEVRTGRDSWKDITDEEGTQWRADYDKGIIEIHRGPGNGTISLRDWGFSDNDDFVRTTYRYGSLGQDANSGGQTTLDTNLSDTDDGNTSVGDANRLPRGQYYFLIHTPSVTSDGSTDGPEYVLATVDGNGVSINSRGERGTTAVSHSNGDIVHYAPLDVREGVAAKAALELLRQDDTLDILIETGDTLQVNERIKELNRQWQSLLARNDGTIGYT